MFSLDTSAGTFTRDFGLNGLSSTVPFDPTTTNIPTTDFFDNRTKYVSSVADLILQVHEHVSVDLGGGGAVVSRQSSALHGTAAANAHGDLQYRFSRHATIGASYTYFHFDFTRIFGATDVHGVAGAFALQITRLLEFTGYAGFARAESKFVQTVAVDPAIAALLGISKGTQVVHTIDYLPNVSGRLSQTFQRGVAYVSGGHTVVPGNGLFLTSYATTLLGGYTYTGIRVGVLARR